MLEDSPQLWQFVIAAYGVAALLLLGALAEAWAGWRRAERDWRRAGGDEA